MHLSSYNPPVVTHFCTDPDSHGHASRSQDSGLPDLGGSGAGSSGLAIALDSAGEAFVSGSTFDWDFPTTAGAPERCNPIADLSGHVTLYGTYFGFISKLAAHGGTLLFSSYIAQGTALAIRPYENIVLPGRDDAGGMATGFPPRSCLITNRA